MTAAICPHCKNSISISVQVLKGSQYRIMTAMDLVETLRVDSRRDVYACNGGGYAVSYQGGTVRPEAITDAINAGILKEKWPDRKLECWVLA